MDGRKRQNNVWLPPESAKIWGWNPFRVRRVTVGPAATVRTRHIPQLGRLLHAADFLRATKAPEN
jgi:hypothetical protein